MSHRLANGLNVSAAICEKVEKVNLNVRYSQNAQLKRQSNALTFPSEVKWPRYERQTPDHALALFLSRLSQCQFLGNVLKSLSGLKRTSHFFFIGVPVNKFEKSRKLSFEKKTMISYLIDFVCVFHNEQAIAWSRSDA